MTFDNTCNLLAVLALAFFVMQYISRINDIEAELGDVRETFERVQSALQTLQQNDIWLKTEVVGLREEVRGERLRQLNLPTITG